MPQDTYPAGTTTPPMSDLATSPTWEFLNQRPGRDPNDLYSEAYRTFLGRAADPGEVGLHIGPRSVGWARGGLQGGLDEIYYSDEGRRFRERPASVASGTGGDTGTGGSTGGGGGTTTGGAADPNWRAPTYTGGTAASTRAPRLTQNAQGQWVLSEHGYTRTLQPNEVAAAQQYVTQFAAQNPTGFIQPGAPGYAPGQAMRNEDYPALTGAGGTGTTTGGTTGTQGATSRFAGSPYAYTGFNLERDQDVSRSAKDAFLHATTLGAQGGAGNQWHTKEGAQAFAEQYVRPYLESQGYQVLGINGDLINIVTREDREAGNTAGSWFDFVVNAGGDPARGETPQLAWQIQSGTGATPTPQTASGQSYRSIFEGLTQGREPTLASLRALEPQLRQYGMSLVYNAAGNGADIRLPNGQIVDVVRGLSRGGEAWQWMGGDGGIYTAPQTTGTTPPPTVQPPPTPPPGINPVVNTTLAAPTPEPAAPPAPVPPPVQPPMSNLVPPENYDPRMV